MKFRIFIIAVFIFALRLSATNIPLPEHPRPDFMRSEWLNLNGNWHFKFDEKNNGIKEGWSNFADNYFDKTIVVPFSWACPLSGINDTKQLIGWYRRNLEIPKTNVLSSLSELQIMVLRYG